MDTTMEVAQDGVTHIAVYKSRVFKRKAGTPCAEWQGDRNIGPHPLKI